MDEKDYYWQLVNTPRYWQNTARDFVCAANLLKKDYYARSWLGIGRRKLSEYERLRQSHTPARAMIVLYALAIENLLKGIIVASGQDPICTDGKLASWFTTHKLTTLAKRAQLSGLDNGLLDQLSAFITTGKYPVGRSDGDGAMAHKYFPDIVVAGIEKILPKIEEKLGSIRTKRDKLPKVDLLRLCAGRKLRYGRWANER